MSDRPKINRGYTWERWADQQEDQSVGRQTLREPRKCGECGGRTTLWHQDGHCWGCHLTKTKERRMSNRPTPLTPPPPKMPVIESLDAIDRKTDQLAELNAELGRLHIETMRAFIDSFGTQLRASMVLQCSSSYLSYVLSGKKRISAHVAKLMRDHAGEGLQ